MRKSIDGKTSSNRDRQPLIRTTHILLVLVHTELLSRLAPATMGALQSVLTSPSPYPE